MSCSEAIVCPIGDLISSIIVGGANDSSCAAAILVSGSIEKFIMLMNQRAEELGAVNTHFTNCTGIHDDRMKTTLEDMALIATSDLLTLKKTIYVANLAESEINEPEENRHYMAVKALADEEGSQLIPICAKLEADIAELDDPEEKAMFMEELGVKESGLDKLIKSSYALLGLISFLTAGSDECRAWTIKKGTKAPQAAGKIHTDFERGFIRAEVIAFQDMKECGSMATAKSQGKVRSEGKEYVMKDGDIVNFLFNV